VSLWAPVAAVLAAALQMAAYTGYQLFYESFRVSPDETGLEYSTILVRSALQLLLLFSLVLLLLVMLSALIAFYGSLGYVYYRWKRRGEARNLGRLFPQRASRYGLLPIVWLVAVLAAAFLTSLGLPKSIFSDAGTYFFLLLVMPSLAVVIGEHVYLRYRGRAEPSLLDLCSNDMTVGGLRRVVLIGASMLVGFSTGGRFSLLGALGATLSVLVLDAVVSRIMDVKVSRTARRVTLVEILRSRWLRNVVFLLVLSLAPLLALGASDRLIRLSQIEPMVNDVRNGKQLTYEPLRVNPFLLAQPKALSVEVLWVSNVPPPKGFEAKREGDPPSRQLTYFGRAQGTAVFYDTKEDVVWRLSVGSIEILNSLR